MTKKNIRMEATDFAEEFSQMQISKNMIDIRVIKSVKQFQNSRTIEYMYFELNKDSVIIKCPYGLSEYKGVKLINLDQLPLMTSPFTGLTL